MYHNHHLQPNKLYTDPQQRPTEHSRMPGPPPAIPPALTPGYSPAITHRSNVPNGNRPAHYAPYHSTTYPLSTNPHPDYVPTNFMQRVRSREHIQPALPPKIPIQSRPTSNRTNTTRSPTDRPLVPPRLVTSQSMPVQMQPIPVPPQPMPLQTMPQQSIPSQSMPPPIPQIPTTEPPRYEEQKTSSEEDDLALAIAISQSESVKRLRDVMAQEDIDLARALEESVLSSPEHLQPNNAVAGSSSGPGTTFSENSSAAASFARRLATEEADETQQMGKIETDAQIYASPPETPHDLPTYSWHSTRNSVPEKKEEPGVGPDLNSPPEYLKDGSQLSTSQSTSQLSTPQSTYESDEAFARQLAAEAEEDERNYAGSNSQRSSEIVSAQSLHSSPDLLRSSSSGSNALRADSIASSDGEHSVAPRKASITPSITSSDDTYSSRGSSAFVDVHPSHPTQFIDPQLTQGVSIGFVAPRLMSSTTEPMNMAFPNIISLPYGRCPPLHLQAPNWRRLLMLMARLSGSRLEPTVEAMSGNKTELKLRTVIQFVKGHHASNDWRTILWFTIDHPVPPSLPGAMQYTSGDCSVLPFSYSLSALPTLLRDGSDTNMTKVFTVPSAGNIPFPTLPINFPNLALYLQAVLDESRKANDKYVNGLCKLSKMMSICYPNEFGEEPERRARATGFIKRVIGLKNNNKPQRRGHNEDTFELVTPFIASDWGA